MEVVEGPWTHLYKLRGKHRRAVVAVVGAVAVATLVVAVVAALAVVMAAARGGGEGTRHRRLCVRLR